MSNWLTEFSKSTLTVNFKITGTPPQKKNNEKTKNKKETKTKEQKKKDNKKQNKTKQKLKNDKNEYHKLEIPFLILNVSIKSPLILISSKVVNPESIELFCNCNLLPFLLVLSLFYVFSPISILRSNFHVSTLDPW